MYVRRYVQCTYVHTYVPIIVLQCMYVLCMYSLYIRTHVCFYTYIVCIYVLLPMRATFVSASQCRRSQRLQIVIDFPHSVCVLTSITKGSFNEFHRMLLRPKIFISPE